MNSLLTAPPSSGNDIQVMFWAIGIVASAIAIGGGMTLWIMKNFTQTRKDLYSKIGFVDRELKQSIKDGDEKCNQTQSDIKLLQQAHGHIEKQMEDMGDKIDVVLKDVAGTKENMNKLEQKVAEQHVTVIGAIQGLGDKILISKLQEQVKERG